LTELQVICAVAESEGSQFASHMVSYQFVETSCKWLKQWCWCGWSQKVEIHAVMHVCCHLVQSLLHYLHLCRTQHHEKNYITIISWELTGLADRFKNTNMTNDFSVHFVILLIAVICHFIIAFLLYNPTHALFTL